MADRSALVLGGGGITGAAWEIGMLAGLVEAGVDLRSADMVIGTSAGANVGAQILSGVPIEELYARQLKEPAGEIPVRLGIFTLLRFGAMLVWPGDERKNRARLGRAALRARTMTEATRRLERRWATRPSIPHSERPLPRRARPGCSCRERGRGGVVLWPPLDSVPGSLANCARVALCSSPARTICARIAGPTPINLIP